MAAFRKSAEDRSNMNSVYKPVAGYVGNVAKEVKDNVKTWKQGLDIADRIRTYPASKRPALKAAAEANAKKAVAERGQLAGSLIGRRYDEKGKRK